MKLLAKSNLVQSSGIQSLSVSNVRIIKSLGQIPIAKKTLLIGDNGSGKTSLLESLYLLSTGKSFRTSRAADLITSGEQSLIVRITAASLNQTLGIEKTTKGATTIHLNGESINKVRELARLRPTLIYQPDSLSLVTGSSTIRRRLIDWGLFHVKHEYIVHLTEYLRALRQRNALLRLCRKQPKLYSDQLDQWDKVLVDYGEKIHKARQELIAQMQDIFLQTIANLAQPEMNIDYIHGLDASNAIENDFAQVFTNNLKEYRDQDIMLGSTAKGPHRSDIAITMANFNEIKNAKDFLSRGQQKCLSFALIVSLAKWFITRIESRPTITLLCDDIASELDESNLANVMNVLETIDAQIVITAIADQSIPMAEKLGYSTIKLVKGAIC